MPVINPATKAVITTACPLSLPKGGRVAANQIDAGTARGGNAVADGGQDSSQMPVGGHDRRR